MLIAALALLTPKGASPETLPYIGSVAAATLSLAHGTARSGWLLKNSDGLYRERLDRRY